MKRGRENLNKKKRKEPSSFAEKYESKIFKKKVLRRGIRKLLSTKPNKLKRHFLQ